MTSIIIKQTIIRGFRKWYIHRGYYVAVVIRRFLLFYGACEETEGRVRCLLFHAQGSRSIIQTEVTLLQRTFLFIVYLL